MTTERELAAVFAPCTLSGLTDEWHRMNMEIKDLRKSRDPLATILLEASVKGADMSVDPAFRKGSVIEGADAAVQAVWHIDNDGREWRPRLEYVR